MKSKYNVLLSLPRSFQTVSRSDFKDVQIIRYQYNVITRKPSTVLVIIMRANSAEHETSLKQTPKTVNKLLASVTILKFDNQSTTYKQKEEQESITI